MTNDNQPQPSKPHGSTPILPAQITETIGAIVKLHADHERAATPIQRLIERLTETLAKPRFLGAFTLFVAFWLGVVGVQTELYGKSFDPPPFNLLQGVLTVLAVYMTAMILSTQRRASELASNREQLTLELATLAEQKSAKTISLLEEIRRDSPTLPDRVDDDASAMAASADPGSVLQAIIESQHGAQKSTEGDPNTDANPE